MAYGLHSIGTFTTRESEPGAPQYTGKVEILKKDYADATYNLWFGTSPVLHKWQEDNTHAPIKGSSLTINLLNINGNTPAERYLSINDDDFMVRLTVDGTIRFIGFLVQDDFAEDMVDYNHGLTLSANDNLGLLKAVPLYVDPALMIDTRCTLLRVVQACINAATLGLNVNIADNLYEVNHTEIDTPLTQTIIDIDTWLGTDNIYTNCWDVLTQVLNRRKASLMQVNGEWWIVRWDELRYGDVRYFAYSSGGNLLGDGLLPATIIGGNRVEGIAKDFFALSAPVKSFQRGYKLDKETFNYKEPKYLLKNFDLQDLGDLIREYDLAGPVRHVKEYVFTSWLGNYGAGAMERFIRVIYDINNKEIDRYAVVRGTPFDTYRAVQSMPIEVASGDKVKVSMSYRTNDSQPGSVTTVFAVRLTNGVVAQDRYVDELPLNNGNWKLGIGYNYLIPSGDNSNQWHSVEIQSGQTPFAGLVYVYLPYANEDYGTAHETQIKGISFEYQPFINDSQRVIGHVHTSEQPEGPKNTGDEEIFNDDSPRPSLAGVLYLPSYTGNIQNRTSLWYRRGFTEALRLGQITTFEQLFWRRVSRKRVEGVFKYRVPLSMITVFKYDAFLDLNFIFGSLEIDYADSSARVTAYEQYKDGDVDSDLISDYTFKYIYEK